MTLGLNEKNSFFKAFCTHASTILRSNKGKIIENQTRALAFQISKNSNPLC